jgi:lipoprotein NlpI
MAVEQRRGNRTKAVLPVRVKGKDSAGKAFEELVHTLDVTPDGARLGSVHRQLNALDEVTVFYRQRKIQFRVVWTKKLEGTSEFQVGLQAITQDSEAWGMNFADYRRQHVSQSPAAAAVHA